MDVWKNSIQEDVSKLKSKHEQMKNEQYSMKDAIRDLQLSDKLQNQEIKTLKDSLFEIKEDTQWIRRKITGALISAILGAVVTGIIGIAIANVFKGGL